MKRPAVRSKGAALAAACALVIGLGVPAHGAYQRPGFTELASPGVPDGWNVYYASLSPDGRSVAFTSPGGCVLDEGCGWMQVYLRRSGGSPELVSVSSDGGVGEGESLGTPLVSDGGRYVAFTSEATNLVPGDTNGREDVFVRDLARATTERVSVSSDGAQANERSGLSGVSADGRYVLFSSLAANLVPGDANGRGDAFVRDRVQATTERVSVAFDGAEASTGSSGASLSADGRSVAFFSRASNLVPGGTNGTTHVFLRDLVRGTTELVSMTSEEEEGECLHVSTPLIYVYFSNSGTSSSISADGRYVAFEFCESNLVPGDANQVVDVYVRDRVLGTTELVSVRSDGTQTEWDCLDPDISDDGRYVSFNCPSNSNLVPYNENTGSDIFLRDRLLGTTEIVSVIPQAGQDVQSWAVQGSMAADGRHVAFGSGHGFTEEDDDDDGDTFVRDRGPDIGVLELSASAAGPTVEAQGIASFSGYEVSGATDPDDDGLPAAEALGAEITSAAILSRALEEDLGIRLRLTELPQPAVGLTGVRLPQPAAGLPGVVYGLSFTAGASRYEVRGAGFPRPAAGGPRFALMRCEVACVEEAPLRGAVGLTGPEAFVSLPLDLLPGAVDLRSVRAFTGVGELATGAVGTLDEVSLPDAPLPRPRVELAIAPEGTQEKDVSYTESVGTDDGRFAAGLPMPPPGDWWVFARACLASCSAPTLTHLRV